LSAGISVCKYGTKLLKGHGTDLCRTDRIADDVAQLAAGTLLIVAAVCRQLGCGNRHIGGQLIPANTRAETCIILCTAAVFCDNAHTGGDCTAVTVGFVMIIGLNRMADGVAEIQDHTLAGVELIMLHDISLDADAGGDDFIKMCGNTRKIILTEQINNLKAINNRLKVAGVLLTIFKKTTFSLAAEEWLRKNSPHKVFETKIRYSDKVDDWTYSKVPLEEFSKMCAASVDYRKFIREYLGEK